MKSNGNASMVSLVLLVNRMNTTRNLLVAAFTAMLCLPAAANLGSADFPAGIESSGPKTTHKAMCGKLDNQCVVTFSGRRMQVDGSGGIDRDQLLGFRSDFDRNETYYYVDYRKSNGDRGTALFLFTNRKAASYFGQALSRWYNQDPRPYPVTY